MDLRLGAVFSASNKNLKRLSTMTPMKPRAYLTISMIALLLFMLVQTAAAQDIVAGVKPGDQFTYSVTGSYSSDAPIDQVPARRH